MSRNVLREYLDGVPFSSGPFVRKNLIVLIHESQINFLVARQQHDASFVDSHQQLRLSRGSLRKFAEIGAKGFLSPGGRKVRVNVDSQSIAVTFGGKDHFAFGGSPFYPERLRLEPAAVESLT